MKDWSDEAFAGYLAAMIDGEGHIERVGECAVRVRIANTVRPTLDAMKGRLGYGRVIEYKRPEGSSYKRLFCYEVSSARELRRLFAECGRYIHMKRDQMLAALTVIDRVLEEVQRIDTRNAAILRAIGEGKIQNDVAKEFGVSPQLVSYLKKGHTWDSVLRGHQARKLARAFPASKQQCLRVSRLLKPEVAA